MSRSIIGLSLVAPALATIFFLFLVPLGGAVTGAFQTEDGIGCAPSSPRTG